MRIASRTALAALAAAFISLVAIGVFGRREFDTVLRDKVDQQLTQRASSAPVLAAVAGRLAESKLAPTVQPARVRLSDGKVIDLGTLPSQPLPPLSSEGWSTARADQQRWRLYTVAVADVPAKGDHALVQFVESLGNTDAAARQLRRRFVLFGLFAGVAAALAGWLFGSLASRPLSRLRRDAASIDPRDRATWQVADRYGAIEVDELAASLRDSLQRVGAETDRRDAALESSRSFAASAAHELRTPLQGALLNLGVAADERTDAATRSELIRLSVEQVQRMGAALAAVRALADAEVADPMWFESVELADLVDAVVADEGRRFLDVVVEVDAVDAEPVSLWREGARLAIANVVRNAFVHAAPSNGQQAHVRVSVDANRVVVDDNGAGIPEADRARLVQRFERGATSAAGSGLGLSICDEVTRAHGGSLVLGTSPLGGTRVVLTFGASPLHS